MALVFTDVNLERQCNFLHLTVFSLYESEGNQKKMYKYNPCNILCPSSVSQSKTKTPLQLLITHQSEKDNLETLKLPFLLTLSCLGSGGPCSVAGRA